MNDKTHFGFQEVDVSRKAEHVGDVFHSVAEEYDLMNDVMSFGPVSYTHLTLPTTSPV